MSAKTILLIGLFLDAASEVSGRGRGSSRGRGGTGRAHSMADSASVRSVSLRMHNDIRGKISSGSVAGQPRSAQALRSLAWDSGLERSAAAYARQCVWRHSRLKGLGENLAIRSHNTRASDLRGSKGKAKARDAAAFHNQGWIDEYKDFRSPFKVGGSSCRAGKKCGHYTQMVHEGTTRVGCAMSFCSKVAGWHSPKKGRVVSYLVCHYSPPGNFKGRTPYKLAGSSKSSQSSRVPSKSRTSWRKTPSRPAKTRTYSRPAKPSRPAVTKSNWRQAYSRPRQPAKTRKTSRPAQPNKSNWQPAYNMPSKPRKTNKKPTKTVSRSWGARQKTKSRTNFRTKSYGRSNKSKACRVTCRAGQRKITDRATGSCYCF